MNQSRYEYIVEISRKILTSVESMNRAYADLPPILNQELDCIKAHTYGDVLEDCLRRKQALGETIAESFESLQQLTQQVYMIWNDEECEGAAQSPGDLSNCIQMLRGLLKRVSVNHSILNAAQLSIVVEKIAAEHSRFKSTAEIVKPRIEVNKMAIENVAYHYQESTRILYELAEQTQAVYTSQGQTAKGSGRSSSIVVKA
jgi:hypothetical protein